MKPYKLSTTKYLNVVGTKCHLMEYEDGTTGAYISPNVVIPEDSTAVILGGTIRGGNILGGTIRGGHISGGTIRGGDIYGGSISGGNIYGGLIWTGYIKGGNIYGGTIRGIADIYGGNIYGGDIIGGIILGGANIYGGTISDGKIRGGNIHDGIIRGGSIYGGDIKLNSLVSINNIGLYDDTLNAYLVDGQIEFTTGIFRGNISEFTKWVATTHPKDTIHYKRYMVSIEYIKTILN